VITIVIADDHQVVRHGVRAVLEAQPGLQVVGEAEDGAQALALVGSLKPAVLITDLMMPAIRGDDLAGQVLALSPKTRVIVLSMHAAEDQVLRTLRSGVSAYVLKGSGIEELLDAVHRVVAGERYVSPALSGVLMDAYLRPRDEKGDPFDTLSDREKEVLTLTAEGHSGPQIASRLFISPRTVENHRASIQRKLGLRTQGDIIKYAIRKRLISLDE
jgi:DNA-binding NarL/FixJ family response regulator